MVDEFFRAWVTFSLMIVGGAIAAAFWAFRAGLFRDQERARSLALWAMVEEEDAPRCSAVDKEKEGIKGVHHVSDRESA